MITDTQSAADLFEYLENNFNKGTSIQYHINDISPGFSVKELYALSQLFAHYQPGCSTSNFYPAVILKEEKEQAIAYLNQKLNE